jgi:RNA polymerase sigma-70 factor, ECF subfamily
MDLVRSAVRGEESAAERLIATIWPSCFRFAASLIGDRTLADDAAQEACIIVHYRIGTLRDVAAFDAWLYRVLIRESRRIAKRHADRALTPQLEVVPEDTIGIDVWHALSQLQPVLREVTVLYYIDDFKSHEIARILGVTHATVRTRLTRARERLRVLLHDYRTDDDVADREDHEHAL